MMIRVDDDKETYFQCILKWKNLDIVSSLCYMYNVSEYVTGNLYDAGLVTGESLIVFGMQEVGNRWLDLDELNVNTVEFLYCTFTTLIGICSDDKKIIFSHCTFRGIALDAPYTEIESAYLSFNDCHIDNCTFEDIEIKYQKKRRDDDNAEISLLNLRQGELENCLFYNCGIKAGESKKCFMQLANCKIHNCQFINCFSAYYPCHEGSLIQIANSELSCCTFEECENFLSGASFGEYRSFLILAERSSVVHDNNFNHCHCRCSSGRGGNLIIALEDSIAMNNVLDGCSRSQYNTFVGDSKEC